MDRTGSYSTLDLAGHYREAYRKSLYCGEGEFRAWCRNVELELVDRRQPLRHGGYGISRGYPFPSGSADYFMLGYSRLTVVTGKSTRRIADVCIDGKAIRRVKLERGLAMAIYAMADKLIDILPA